MGYLSGMVLFIGSISNILHLNSTYMNDYTDHIKTYNKVFSYDNFDVFKSNIKEIDNINNNEKFTFNVEMNQMGDNKYTMEPFIINEYDEYYKPPDMDVPDEVDWRKNNTVTDVKNQGRCGSCWAFSTTGSVEGIIAIKEGKLYNISEQQLVDCSITNNGCSGGTMDNAYQYIINNGLCSEKNYSYEGVDDVCRSDNCTSIVNISSYKNLHPSEKVLKQVVAQQPVSVAIQADLTSFKFYSGGIYNDPNCGDELDHGVLVVGYGIDDELNMEYWIVKNSWGKEWGENGYIRILRGSNKEYGLCGISNMPSIPEI